MHNTSLSPSSAMSSPREFGSCKLCGKDRNINKTFLVSYFSREEEHIVVFVKNLFNTWLSNEHKQITCGTQAVAAERMRWRDPMVRKPRLLKSTSLSCGIWRTSTSSSTNLSMWLARPWKRKILFLWKIHSRTQHLATEEVGDIVMVGDTPRDHEKGNRYKYCSCHNGWE